MTKLVAESKDGCHTAHFVIRDTPKGQRAIGDIVSKSWSSVSSRGFDVKIITTPSSSHFFVSVGSSGYNVRFKIP